MAIKAKIPSGEKHCRTNPMYQWDYGQTLEIEAENLPSIIEVHFACHGMDEAVVHTCSAVNGVATVAIPDRCLEQAKDITAWVYEVDGTAGRTIYSVTIPITARTRPAKSESIPQLVQDAYTQLITEVNELLEALQGGTVNVGYAAKAGLADKATTADNANTAASATTAGGAVQAIMATKDSAGNIIKDTYMKIPDGYTRLKVGDTLPIGLYHFVIMHEGATFDNGHSFIADLGCKGYFPTNVYSPLITTTATSSGDSLDRVVFTFNYSPDSPQYAYTSVQRGTFQAIGDTNALYALKFADAANADDNYFIYYNKLSN